MFDKLSETELVQLSSIWYSAIVFGLYGYVAEKIITIVIQGKAVDFRSAYKFWSNNLLTNNILLGILARFFFFPFPIFNKMKPLPVAFVGAIIWGLLLIMFFKGVFPAL